MDGLAILKDTFGVNDEAWCRRIENPYFQYFSVQESFQYELPFERSCSQFGDKSGRRRFCRRACSVAVGTEALKPQPRNEAATFVLSHPP